MDPVIIALIVLVLVIVILGILIFQSNSRSSIDKDFIDNLPEDLKLMLNENKTQTSEKVETLLQPIREALEKNEKQMMDMAKERNAILFANASGNSGMPKDSHERVENLEKCMTIPIRFLFRLDPIVCRPEKKVQ